jgi:serine/threonine protein kinase
LFEVYESDNYIYLVVELLHGGELFERIVKKGQYGERDACVLMKKLLSSLNYMHQKGIMHRDIKPENLILKDPDNDGDVKIADFGLATYVNATEYLFKRCGTPGYVAPEILADEKYDQKVDVFSAGVILYILLTGGSPFHGKSYNEILWKNKNCEIKFNFKDYGHKISEAATDLMKKLLEKDPKIRISAEEALNHEWIQNDGVFLSPKSQAPIFLSSAQENMKKFQEQNRFNVKNIKPKDLDKAALEKSIHAPSPLITGKLTEMQNSNPQLMNSPDVRLGPGVTMKKVSRFNNQQVQQGQQSNGQTEESDDIDVISDEKTSINQNIKNYQNVGLNNIIGRMRDVNGVGVKPPESPNIMKKVVEQKTQKKAIGVQSNLLNFLKKNQPENQVQFTLNSDKANNVKNILRDMEK